MSETLAAAPEAAVSVFAYGSLMWRPCFAFDERTAATLEGYRRAFNFWSIRARGTAEAPGLGLGLEPGGACHGVLYRIAADNRDDGLAALWEREMLSDVYLPRWLPVVTPDGPRQALCFVTNPAHMLYAGELDGATAARCIARAAGSSGRCRDYLADMVAALARHGLADPDMDRLLALVDGLTEAE